ncbi:MAG: NAD(P)H-hydrate dehydratase [Lachnospiraceae bacterium]|nr:NAD(P)H-hydrate dehydratase [Lachnospiraceae bacterium]
MSMILDAEQAREVDRISIRELGMPSLVLMERASLGVAKAVAERYSPENNILAVCGSGNNGGDGVAAARMLSEWGYPVTILLLGKEEKFTEEMAAQVRIARNLGMRVERDGPAEMDLAGYSVILDGIFGIGLDREVRGNYRNWMERINKSGVDVCAIDIPSGIHATTGKVLGTSICAKFTVTFGSMKLGMSLFPGRIHAGEVIVEDIGFPKEAYRGISRKYFTYDREDLRKYFPRRIAHSNKGSYGKLLVVAGSDTMGGAALFAARAAYLMGAGLVKVVTHENNRVMLQEKLPEALLGVYGDDGAYDLTKDLAWATAVVIGPGLGQGEAGKGLLRQVLRLKDDERALPILIDADGLNILAGWPEYFDGEGRLLLPEHIVVTPHLKELSRLGKCSVEDVAGDLIGSARNHAAGAVMVQKDAVTLVSDGRQVYVNGSGNNALAKGGSGDVLSGIIGGLLARGADGFLAGCLGVYLHGLTAEEYVKRRSPSSMLASDILEMLPRVLPDLGRS